jgi:hypothetical protein
VPSSARRLAVALFDHAAFLSHIEALFAEIALDMLLIADGFLAHHEFFLDDRALLDHELFLDDRNADLIVTEPGLPAAGFSLYRAAIHADSLALHRHGLTDVLGLGMLPHDHLAHLGPALADVQLLFGA